MKFEYNLSMAENHRFLPADDGSDRNRNFYGSKSDRRAGVALVFTGAFGLVSVKNFPARSIDNLNRAKRRRLKRLRQRNALVQPFVLSGIFVNPIIAIY